MNVITGKFEYEREFTIEFTLTIKEGIPKVVKKVFSDTNLNNPVNEAQKLLNQLKEKGFTALFPVV